MKDFDIWNYNKKKINSKQNYQPHYRNRQIRWCSLGINIGFEQDGTGRNHSRPVLILKGLSRHVCIILPLTTSKNKNSYLLPIGKIDGKNAQIIISQIRLIDTRRLGTLIETLDVRTFNWIRKTIKAML